jgi:hypothetical protein
VFKSLVLVFLIVLSINEKNARAFYNAAAYLLVLSRFFKLLQMLVIQRAVAAAKDRDIEHSANVLDNLRKRFLI